MSRPARTNAYSEFIRAFLIACLLFTFALPCSAQKDKKKEDDKTSLVLDKRLPVFVRTHSSGVCSNGPLLTALRDSLGKEGFEIIDSARYVSIVRSFFMNDMFNALKDVKNPEEIPQRMKQLITSKSIAQELAINNASCVDTLYNYTIHIYVSPKPTGEVRSLSFTLPFSSQARILDIILSLIERAPAKK